MNTARLNSKFRADLAKAADLCDREAAILLAAGVRELSDTRRTTLQTSGDALRRLACDLRNHAMLAPYRDERGNPAQTAMLAGVAGRRKK